MVNIVEHRVEFSQSSLSIDYQLFSRMDLAFWWGGDEIPKQRTTVREA